MMMMFFAASLTSSKVQIVSLQSSEPAISSRHQRNINRAESPLKIADGAIIIDNGNLTIAEGFTKILEYIKI